MIDYSLAARRNQRRLEREGVDFDPYVVAASIVFGIPACQVTPEKRRAAKLVVFADANGGRVLDETQSAAILELFGKKGKRA